MNLKYYLRGLGLGIVMSAIVLGITASGKKTALTEEEIVAKAKDLGMVEEEELEKQLEDARAEAEQRVRKEAMEEYASADEGDLPEEAGDSVQDILEEAVGEGQETEDGQADESGQGESSEEETEGQEESAADNSHENGNGPVGDSETSGMTERGMAEGEKHTVFIVKKGESPYSIGKRMEEEGLLPKDAGFDRYLVDHGYDTKVVAAEYEIPADADMDTIAKIITKQN
ncbi:hypothetical protein D3Z45_14205 [Lachnospiraceae bacterium]|nr:hypothetical protein [Lachnospiraceae bacterium]